MPDMVSIISSAVADYKTENNIVDDPNEGSDGYEAPENTETPESAAERTVETVGAEPAATVVTPEPAAKVVEPKVAVVADPKDDEIGPSHDKYGRENRIPHSRVNTMLTKREAKVTERLKAEYEPKLQEVTSLKDKLASFESVEALFLNPAAFIAKLRDTDGYRELLSQPAAATVAQTEESDEFTEPMPTPGNTQESLQQLLDWTARRAVFMAEKKITARYKPIEDERKQRDQAEAARQAMMPRVQADIAEARTWEGFKTYEKDIIAELQRDRRLSLSGAYQRIVIPKLKGDEAAMRTKLLAEIAGTPTATATAPTATPKKAVATKSGPRDTADVIRESLREQGLIGR